MALVLNSALQLGTWTLLDSTLLLHQHVMNECRVAYRELRYINSIRNLLSIIVVKTLVCSLVLSHIYCNSLFVGLPHYLINRLQGVQNAAARSIFRTPRSKHISPLLQSLHWLPVNRRTLHTYLLRYVILHYVALALSTCLTLLMFTPLPEPCALPQILVS